MLAGELKQLPSGDLAMFFPVKSVQYLPLKVASGDESLFEDLATMHAERLGIRPDGMAGQLSDSFVVASGEDSTVLLHAVLNSPGEGELPLRTPKEFDLSARAFPVDGDAVTVWKELGRWVFGIHSGGKLLYAQATSNESSVPDEVVMQDIRLALGQLGMQGLRVKPEAVYVWPPEGELGEAGVLAEGLGVTATIERRPDPQIPDPVSHLLPADVRAARKERQQRNQIVGLGALVVLAYFGFFGWMGYGLWVDSKKADKLAREAAAVDEISLTFQKHRNMWDELEPVVEDQRTPMEIMLQVKNAIPRNSGLRLKTADINTTEVKLLGAAPKSGPINAFSLALKRSSDLSWLEWTNQAPSNTAKGWTLTFTAKSKE